MAKIPTKDEIDLVIYHADCFDGTGAAWAAWKYLGDKAEYIPKQHGEDPFTIDYEGRNILMVDFSWDRKTLETIAKKASSLFVLDHHEKMLKELEGFPNARLDMTQSGAVLSWKFFHDTPVPAILRHIQDLDLHKFELEDTPATIAILSMEALNIQRIEEIHYLITYGDPDLKNQMYQVGKTLVMAQRKKVEIKAEKMVRGVLVAPDGSEYPCFVGNTTSPNAVCNEALKRESGRIAVGWFYDYSLGFFRVSLRSDNSRPNVNEIAAKFGGGGHRNAAGFSYHGDIRDLVRCDCLDIQKK